MSGCISPARRGLWLMPASDRMGPSSPLPLKIIEIAVLNTKLSHRLNEPTLTFRWAPKLSQQWSLKMKKKKQFNPLHSLLHTHDKINSASTAITLCFQQQPRGKLSASLEGKSKECVFSTPPALMRVCAHAHQSKCVCQCRAS